MFFCKKGFYIVVFYAIKYYNIRRLRGVVVKEFLSNLRFSYKYVKEQKKYLFGFAICQALTVLISVAVPILSANIIIYLTNSFLNQLVLLALVLTIVEMLRNFLNYFARKFMQILFRETYAKLQIEIGANILTLTNQTIDENGSGVFIQRITGDTSRIADIFEYLCSTLASIITDIGIFGAVMIINIYAGLFLIAMMIILYVIESIRTKKRNEADKLLRKEREKASGFISELVRGVRDIKMLYAEESFMDRFSALITNLNGTSYKMSATNRSYNLLRGSVSDALDFLFICLLCYLIYIGDLKASLALVVYNYSNRTGSIIFAISSLMEQGKDFNLSCARIRDIIDDDKFPKETFGPKKIKRVKGNFEFKNVSFHYEDKDNVLKDLSFKIKSKETVAFVGKSGAGKTTIFSLLCKMYNPSSGTILIDDEDINNLDKETIRGNITIISQDPYIFNLSIKDNFKLVKKNLTKKEMIEACKMACLDEFIESLPDKYDTIIGEGGVNLSGGQKQRLAIARALVQKTEIILFDEATSALDNETQHKIQEAIDNMKNEYTILIIAHRLSTIKNADRILLLDNGKIKAEGTHNELLKKSKEYRHLYESEISKKD